MLRRSPRRKPDLFSALLLAVAVALSLSIAYQLHTDRDLGVPPMAEQMRIFVVTSGG